MLPLRGYLWNSQGCRSFVGDLCRGPNNHVIVAVNSFCIIDNVFLLTVIYMLLLSFFSRQSGS
jgi:hypothetical protein